VRAKIIKLIQESNFEQRRKNVNFEGRGENTEIIIILVIILIGKQEIAKRVSKIILKGKRESLRKIILEGVKIIGENELEMENSAGSVGERCLSGRNVRASRKTRSS